MPSVAPYESLVIFEMRSLRAHATYFTQAWLRDIKDESKLRADVP